MTIEIMILMDIIMIIQNNRTNSKWSDYLNHFAFAYNSISHVITNSTPFQLSFGKLPYLANDVIENRTPK